MDIEFLREYCLSLPGATEDMAFGEDCLLFRVDGKIFGCLSFVRADLFTVKLDPTEAVELRERYAEIEPAWHWNKKYWSQITLNGSLEKELILSLIRKSYHEVVMKLPLKVRREHPEYLTVV